MGRQQLQGVGVANREQIEKTFYRAFTQLMPSNATFSVARAVTIQAARDLYGAGSAVAGMGTFRRPRPKGPEKVATE